eukprot:jgi/Tetstr1/444104/TSEL_032003.t1
MKPLKNHTNNNQFFLQFFKHVDNCTNSGRCTSSAARGSVWQRPQQQGAGPAPQEGEVYRSPFKLRGVVVCQEADCGKPRCIFSQPLFKMVPPAAENVTAEDPKSAASKEFKPNGRQKHKNLDTQLASQHWSACEAGDRNRERQPRRR